MVGSIARLGLALIARIIVSTSDQCTGPAEASIHLSMLLQKEETLIYNQLLMSRQNGHLITTF